jgi:hypothetical protein
MPRRSTFALLGLGLVAASCSSTTIEKGRQLRPDHAPTPYTAEQIREGCPTGRVAVFLIEVPGRPKVHQVHRFVDAGAEGVTHETTLQTLEGRTIGEDTSTRSRWKELQAHASFPERATRVSEARITVPAGSFDCRLYTVTTMEKGEKVTKHLHFARALPGPPVRFEQSIDDRVVFTMTLIRSERPE